MSTAIRPEVSKKNKYWISKNHYYELKHFCFQYPEWKKEHKQLEKAIGVTRSNIEHRKSSDVPDPTEMLASRMAGLSLKIRLVDQILYDTDPSLLQYLLKGITEGYPYEYLSVDMKIPCGKNEYYEKYRKFFWLLAQER